jgi:methyl-accepting chemotaxis protein
MVFTNLPLSVRLWVGFGLISAVVVLNTVLAAAAVDGAARTLIVLAGGVCVAVGALTAWWLTQSVIGPLHNAVSAARQINSGDLTGNFDASGNDEVGELLRALKSLKDLIFKVVSEVRTGTTTVAGTASQINRDNTALADRTRHQADSLQTTATSMRQITVTVKQNADHAEQASNFVLSASDNAVKGGEVVNQVVATMGSIKQSSRKIVDIIGVIDSIAFQTNILALNAAVEPARAGEQGKGFAVVASEVGTLAKRSAAAAKEIKGLIGASVEKVDSGAHLVDEAGKKITEIVSSVKHVADLMRTISEESHEQSKGVESVNGAINKLDNMIKLNAALVSETTKTATSVNEYAVDLLKSVSGFNLGQREYGTVEEATQMVKHGIEFMKANGRDALIADVNQRGKGRFVDRDLYLMVVSLTDNTFKAHGNNPRIVGNSGLVSKDVDGKQFVIEMIDLGKSVGSGWVDYKWNHPVTNEVRTKSSYIERCDDVIVVCGVYKD